MLTFSEAQLMAWVMPVFWPFLRVLAVFTAAPVLSNRATPIRVRIALSFLIALAAQPALPAGPVIGLNDPGAMGAVVQQVLVGLAIGFAARVVFAAVELAGELVGLQTGLNFASFFDPTLGSQSSAIGRFFAHAGALLFVVLNGHLLLAGTVVRSFNKFPVNGNPLESLNALPLHQLGAEMFSYGLWIALPMIGILMFVNAALGIMSRIAPQMNVFAIGFPVTLAAGLLGMTATLPLMEQPFTRLIGVALAVVGG